MMERRYWSLNLLRAWCKLTGQQNEELSASHISDLMLLDSRWESSSFEIGISWTIWGNSSCPGVYRPSNLLIHLKNNPPLKRQLYSTSMHRVYSLVRNTRGDLNDWVG